MADAFEHGISHFDVARSYGFGDAESVLGEFIAGKRPLVTVTTKFGVVPPTLKAWQRVARPILRAARDIAVPLKAALKKSSQKLLTQRNFEVSYARRCLETSLRELRTDYVDCFLLHEPDLGTMSDREELRGFLEGCIKAGTVRRWGLAHPTGESPPEHASNRWGQVLQVASPLGSGIPFRLGEDDQRIVFITQPLGGGTYAAEQSLAGLCERSGWSRHQLAMALACASAGARGAIIAAMYTRSHMMENIAAVEHYEEHRNEIDRLLWGHHGSAQRG